MALPEFTAGIPTPVKAHGTPGNWRFTPGSSGTGGTTEGSRKHDFHQPNAIHRTTNTPCTTTDCHYDPDQSYRTDAWI